MLTCVLLEEINKEAHRPYASNPNASDQMRLLLVTITLTFVAFAALQFNDPDFGLWVSIYLAAAAVSGATLIDGLPRLVHRVLAVCTMLMMFFYFFGFFEMAPTLHGDWWHAETSREAFGLLFSAFAMIPVLSCYSCQLKAKRAAKDRRSPAVFSAPPAS